VVPTAAQQKGDFSGIGYPLINFAAGGAPFPDNQIPAGMINPVCSQRGRSLSQRERKPIGVHRNR
jgi:hypothetical protein